MNIKQFVPQEICLRCQGCCRFREADSVWLPCLMDAEIQDLLDHDLPAASISMDRKIQPVQDKSSEGFICAFFSRSDNQCKIYALRPFECQLYPFLINLRGKKVILTVDLNCPYVSEHLNSKEFKEYTDYLVAYLNSPEMIRLLKDNPQLLKTYEDIAEVIELKMSKD